MCFNTFIQHIKAEKYRQFGFSFKLLNPIHWFQFADDAAVITGQESENQHLLNRYSIWCQWSNMIIRVDKCSTFGIQGRIKHYQETTRRQASTPPLSQGSFFSNIIKHSTFSLNSIWSFVQSKLPKNIFNFTIRYINNTLPTRKNLQKWEISPTSECLFCLNPESLLHVVAGCKTYLNEGRFTWRHDSVLNFIASILKSVNHSNLYADLPSYISPSVLTGDELRPDLLITLEDKCIYILELTVGFESNLLTNATRKRQKYQV